MEVPKKLYSNLFFDTVGPIFLPSVGVKTDFAVVDTIASVQNVFYTDGSDRIFDFPPTTTISTLTAY